MGVRGPIPKSAESREYSGNPSHKPLPPSRSAGSFGMPDRPKGMPAAARRYWDFYIEHMALNGTLRPIDGPCLEMVCTLSADLQQLEREKRRLIGSRKRQAKEEKRVIEGGAMVEFEMTIEGRRLVQTINGIRSQLRTLCDRYGLNPMSGSRLSSAGDAVNPTAGRGVPAEVNKLESLIQ
jgi:hypothetical protein